MLRAPSACRMAAAMALAAAAVTFLPAAGSPAAAADYATSCASPTSTLTGGGSQSLSVGAGQTVLLASGTFTGGIDALPVGATLCVAAGATLQPPYANNAAGSIYVQGTATFPSLAVQGTFLLENEGTASFPQGVNTNGPATLDNRGSLTFGTQVSLSGGAQLLNAVGATITANGGLNLNAGTTLDNDGTLTVAGALTSSGTVTNAGSMTVSGELTLDGGSTLANECTVTAGAGLANNGTFTNDGTVTVSAGVADNNAQLRQGPTGLLLGVDFTNNNTVTGFGAYRFTGHTVTQATFAGDTADQPIVFEDTTPTGTQLFDVQSGVVANVVAGVLTAPGPGDLPPGCAQPPATTADLAVSKTGPATATVGDTVTYTVTASNLGPGTATGVVVTDAIPAALTAVTISDGGLVAGPLVTWTLGSLAAGAVQTLTVTGTASAVGQMTDVASGTTTSYDPDPANNDGSSPSATVTTDVTDLPPPVNHPPTIDDVTLFTTANVPVSHQLAASDPDAGQRLRFARITAPGFGLADVYPNGVTTYIPDDNFTGRDSYGVRVCDNGTPVLCADATVTVVVAPVAGDVAQTIEENTQAVVDLDAAVIGITGPPTVVTPPSSGAVSLAGFVATYTPDPGFIGTDTFTYQVCSTQAPDVCDSAVVTITVVPPPVGPPVVEDLALATVAEQPVSGLMTVTQPPPGAITSATITAGPTHGTASAAPDGQVTYTPTGNFAGIDQFTVEYCNDQAPPGCASGIVTVTVSPIARADVAQTPLNTPVDIDVLANDTGTVGLPTVTTAPGHGTATVGPTGVLTYTPGIGFSGVDTLTYQICALTAPTVCDTAEVVIAVATTTPPPPVLGDVERTAVVPATVSGVLVGGAVASQTLTYGATSPPAHGTATVAADGAYTYTQTDTFVGADSFGVEACTTAAPVQCAAATVTVLIYPVAQPASVEITVNDSATVAPVTVGDVGPPTVTGGPAHGTVTVSGSSFVYTPDPNFTGADRFIYQVCGTATPVLCTSSLVDVTVLPLLVDDDATTLADQGVGAPVEQNDVGTVGDPVVVGPPRNGQATAGPTITYTPSAGYTGYDYVVYQRCSVFTATVCGTATLTVAVYPDLRDDAATTTEGVAVTVGVEANDIGLAGAPTIIDPPGDGTATVVGDPITYTPLPGFTGTDTFTYQRCSPNAPSLCSTATVVVDVVAPTPAPPSVVPPSPSPTAPPAETAAATVPTSTPGAGEATLAFTGPPVPLGWLVGGGLLLVAGGGLLVRRAGRRRRTVR